MSLPTFPRPQICSYDIITHELRVVAYINPQGEDTTWEIHWGEIGGPYSNIVSVPLTISASLSAQIVEHTFIVPPPNWGERECKIYATNASGTSIGRRRAWVM